MTDVTCGLKLCVHRTKAGFCENDEIRLTTGLTMAMYCVEYRTVDE